MFKSFCVDQSTVESHCFSDYFGCRISLSPNLKFVGCVQYESNARFVKWSDGSMQLLLGGEVLDLSVQNAAQDQSHLFVRHPKVSPKTSFLCRSRLVGTSVDLLYIFLHVFINFGLHRRPISSDYFILYHDDLWRRHHCVSECRPLYNLKAKF